MLPRCVAADPINCVVVSSPAPTTPPTITANDWVPAIGGLSYEYGQQLPSGVRVPAPADSSLSSFTFAPFSLPPGPCTVYVCIRYVYASSSFMVFHTIVSHCCTCLHADHTDCHINTGILPVACASPARSLWSSQWCPSVR